METLYSWEFDDNKERWAYWYIIALSIMIGIVIWGFLTKQYWMSFIILLVSGLFYYIENNSDDTIKVILTDVWIQVWLNFYEYQKIEKYTYIFDWDTPFYIRLVINKMPLKSLDLNINKDNYNNLKNILPNYLMEDTKGELSFIDKLIHKMKL